MKTRVEKKKILIVEPDKKIEKSIRHELKDISDKIYAVNNGIDGIKVVEQKLPEIAIINLNIDDINGYELCRLIKSNYPTKVITITLDNEVISHIRAQQEGADASLSLPLKSEEIKNTIKKLE